MLFCKGTTVRVGPINKHWVGHYSYDPSPDVHDSFKETQFELQMNVGWLGRVTGTIFDAESGIPGPAVIYGRLRHHKIRFKKKYENLWIPDADGKLTLIPGQPSHVLYYEGQLAEDCHQLSGTWKTRTEIRWFDGGLWQLQSIGGTWMATSESK
ncbi:MAG: hypothetical protein ACI93T_003523 [Porticoccaceae bacterium]